MSQFFKFLLLSDLLFIKMPGVCPRCDKNVYFAEEVLLSFLLICIFCWQSKRHLWTLWRSDIILFPFKVKGLFYIFYISGEGSREILSQDVLQMYWLRVDNPSIHLVNLSSKWLSIENCKKYANAPVLFGNDLKRSDRSTIARPSKCPQIIYNSNLIPGRCSTPAQ